MKRDLLDQAIDHVAARLTHVEDNDTLASHIINALPERVTWFGWLFHSWAPRLAVGVLAIGASLVVLRTSDERSTGVLRTENANLPIVELRPAASQTIVEQPWIVRRTTVERPSNDRRTIDVPDFERSLPSLGAVAALEFDSLAPDALPATESLVLESLVIADLPLTAEPISPR